MIPFIYRELVSKIDDDYESDGIDSEEEVDEDSTAQYRIIAEYEPITDCIRCEISRTLSDFTLEFDTAFSTNSPTHFIKVGDLILAEYDGKPFEFRVFEMSISSSNTATFQCRYRGYDLNGIYPRPVYNDFAMRTPADAVNLLQTWKLMGRYGLQYDDYNGTPCVRSKIICNENSFIFPFWLGTQGSLMEYANNDVAANINYDIRPTNRRDFEIIPKSKRQKITFKEGINIQELNATRGFSENYTGVVIWVKYEDGEYDSAESVLGIPGRYTAVDVSGDEILMVASSEADYIQTKDNRYGELRFASYDITPTPDVSDIDVGDLIYIDYPTIGVYEVQDNPYNYRSVNITSISYDVINECFTSISAGNIKKDIVDAQLAEKEQTDELETARVISYIKLRHTMFDADGNYTFTTAGSSDYKLVELFDAGELYDTPLPEIGLRITAFEQASSNEKRITVHIDLNDAPQIFNCKIGVKLYARS